MEHRIAYMRPRQVLEEVERIPLVYIPVAPLEWHGPHLPMGVDALNAQNAAMGVCEITGGVVWPTLFWGTERERSPEMLGHLGFEPDEYVVGMDFPANTLPSGYCPEEILGLLVRETLRQAITMGFRKAVLVNGHGAANHIVVLERLAIEFSNTTDLDVLFAFAVKDEDIAAASIGHATFAETSIVMHCAPDSVDLNELPPVDTPIHYKDYAIVDGPGFDGRGRADKRLEDDPRTSSSEAGKAYAEEVIAEIVEKVKVLLAQ